MTDAPKLIRMFYHCRRCYQELPPGVAMREFARIECGSTKVGLQVRCVRHGINIVHLDFEGRILPADLGPYGEFGQGSDWWDFHLLAFQLGNGFIAQQEAEREAGKATKQ